MGAVTFVSSSADASPNKPRASILKLLFATICFSGIQFGWALQIALLTPFILELGLPPVWVTLVWLCGPIAGLLVQPTVGAISDSCTKSILGRRRPFILVGAVLVVVSLLMIPNSLDIGYYIFKDSKVPGQKPVAVAITVIGFWILDCSNNMLQGPCRALVADIAANDQQELGSAFFSIWLAVGNILGYMAGFIPWSSFIKFTITEACNDACNNLRICFAISIVLLVVTTIITLIVAKEKKSSELKQEEEEEERKAQEESAVEALARDEEAMPMLSSSTVAPSRGQAVLQRLQANPIIKMLITIVKMSPAMRRICAVQFFSWFAWFTFLIYSTNWIAEDIFGGNATGTPEEQHKFNEGVRYGCIGLAIFAAISLVTSPIMPKLISLIGAYPVWLFGEVCLVLFLALTAVIKNQWAGIILIGLFGLPWSVSMTVPFALTAKAAPPKENGTYMGILNIFVVIPQLLMAGVGPLLILLGKQIQFSGIIMSMLTGSLSAVASCVILILFIVIDVRKRRLEKELQTNPMP